MAKIKVCSLGEELKEGFYFDPRERLLLYCLGPKLENEFQHRIGYVKLSASETPRLIPFDKGDVEAYILACKREISFAQSKLEQKSQNPQPAQTQPKCTEDIRKSPDLRGHYQDPALGSYKSP